MYPHCLLLVEIDIAPITESHCALWLASVPSSVCMLVDVSLSSCPDGSRFFFLFPSSSSSSSSSSLQEDMNLNEERKAPLRGKDLSTKREMVVQYISATAKSVSSLRRQIIKKRPVEFYHQMERERGEWAEG